MRKKVIPPKNLSPLPWKVADPKGFEQILDSKGKEVCGIYPNEGGGFHLDVDIRAAVRAINSYYYYKSKRRKDGQKKD